MLHHVGAGAAGVQDGVVYPGVPGHVLPQELHAYSTASRALRPRSGAVDA